MGICPLQGGWEVCPLQGGWEFVLFRVDGVLPLWGGWEFGLFEVDGKGSSEEISLQLRKEKQHNK